MADFTSEDMAPQTEQEFLFRKDCFAEELRDAAIPRVLWAAACDMAQHFKTDKGLDGFLARLEKQYTK